MAEARYLRLEEITQAFAELGGEADWRDILKCVTEKRGGSYSPYKDWHNYRSTMSQHIQQHCEGYKKFTGTVLFEKVHEGRFRVVTARPGDLTWGQKDRHSLTPIAVDIAEAPPRLQTEIYRVLRDTKLAREVKWSHAFRCQVCHHPPLKLSEIKLYAEVHHIKPLGSPHDGPDAPDNILCVCPNCHVLLDYGAVSLDLGQLGTSSTHMVGREYVHYHNQQIFRKVKIMG